MVSQISINELLEGVQKLSAEDFDLFFKKIQKLRTEKEFTTLSDYERNLLERIKAGLPLPFKKRFFHLTGKRDEETLTSKEHEELLELTEKYEQYELDRLRLMVQLAESRGISLPELVKQFNLSPQPNA